MYLCSKNNPLSPKSVCKMKRFLVLGLKIFGGIVIFLLILLVGAAVALNNSTVQNITLTFAQDANKR